MRFSPFFLPASTSATWTAALSGRIQGAIPVRLACSPRLSRAAIRLPTQGVHEMSSSSEHPTSKPVVLFSAGATTYELLRYLGATSNGEVLLARRRYSGILGSSVLIKRLQEPSNAVASARLLDEVKLIMQLDHPCIAQVYLVRMHDGSPHVVMENVHGNSLADLLNLAAMRAAPLSEAFAAYVVG